MSNASDMAVGLGAACEEFQDCSERTLRLGKRLGETPGPAAALVTLVPTRAVGASSFLVQVETRIRFVQLRTYLSLEGLSCALFALVFALKPMRLKAN
jgi:hypothetical protein